MSGAFPFVYTISRVLTKPLHRISERFEINETSALGFLASLA
ncbi:MAG: ethanolamine utilization protein EutH, partial [Clostridia bacterium]|nr:ethanolamine utilization protein EutH [Clostridia bacterium]